MKTQLSELARVKRYGALLFARPLNKDEYRVLGKIAVMCVLLSASIVFVAAAFRGDSKPELALVAGACAIPGSLFAGVICILSDRHFRVTGRPVAANRPSALRVISTLVIGIATYVVLHYAIPSRVLRVTVLLAVIAIMGIGRRFFRKKSNSMETD